MKILIIGSKGFIGSHAEKYFSQFSEVWGIDIVENAGGHRYYRVDGRNCSFDSVFENNSFDVCINASGNGSVPISINRPVFDFELNVLNTIKILEAIRIHSPACRFINMSSAAVYGNQINLPIKESVQLNPLSPYGWHKLYAEQVCKEYFYLYNIHTINLRLFSVYGENLKKQLFWDIYQQCLRSEDVDLFGSGRETRDFIYIDDLMHAIDCVIARGLFNGECVNVASGIETEIREAASIFVKNVSPKINLRFNMIVKPGDPLNWRADISRLKSFGFEAKTEVSEGLKKVVRWLKEQK